MKYIPEVLHIEVNPLSCYKINRFIIVFATHKHRCRKPRLLRMGFNKSTHAIMLLLGISG